MPSITRTQLTCHIDRDTKLGIVVTVVATTALYSIQPVSSSRHASRNPELLSRTARGSLFSDQLHTFKDLRMHRDADSTLISNHFMEIQLGFCKCAVHLKKHVPTLAAYMLRGCVDGVCRVIWPCNLMPRSIDIKILRRQVLHTAYASFLRGVVIQLYGVFAQASLVLCGSLSIRTSRLSDRHLRPRSEASATTLAAPTPHS